MSALKGMAQPQAWTASDVSALPKKGESSDLARLPRIHQPSPFDTFYSWMPYGEYITCWQ